MCKEKSDGVKIRFLTEGVFSRDTIKEFVDFTLRRNILLILAAVCCLEVFLCGIYSLTRHLTSLAAVCFVFIVLAAAAVMAIRRNKINISVHRITEVYGTDTITCRTWFTDEMFISESIPESRQVRIRYGDISCMYETNRYVFFLTKGKQFSAVFKENLTNDEKTELFQFLKEKGIRKRRFTVR